MSDFKARLNELGVSGDKVATPLANYVLVQKAGDIWFLSGALCVKDGTPLYVGRLGEDVTQEQGYEAARQCAINLLSVLDKEFDGDWSHFEQIVKLQGFVNSAADFTAQPAVVNGASDLMVETFGDQGKHARTAVGVNVLPANHPVEVEMIVKVK